MQPTLCTGCEKWWYLEDGDTPCPHCFPGLTRERMHALVERITNEVIDDYFALRAAACTTRDDCTCGRTRDEHRMQRGE